MIIEPLIIDYQELSLNLRVPKIEKIKMAAYIEAIISFFIHSNVKIILK